jgi:hypothetical protein
MRQCPWEEQTIKAQEHAKRRVGAWHHDLGWKKAGLRSWGTAVAAGALLPCCRRGLCPGMEWTRAQGLVWRGTHEVWRRSWQSVLGH